jgi:L-lactate dehydrogenase complex protein LldG
MSARERILRRVIATCRGDADAAAIERLIEQRSRGPQPVPGADLARQFCERAAQLASDVVRVASLTAVAPAVAQYLDRHGVARRAVCWPEMTSLPWSEHKIELEARAARGDDAVGITGAFAAIAETGTLMLLSGSDTPATVSLLPQTHIAVVRADCLVATMEDGFSRLRAERGAIPRAVNFVSGPSRTADVEQTVTLGAHGPRRVLIVLVEG